MSNTVPAALQDEFSQADWDNLTEAEQEGMMEDGGGNAPTAEELEQQREDDAAREEAAAAAAQPKKTEEELAAEQAAADQTEEQKSAAAEAAAAAEKEEEKPEHIEQRPRGVVEQVLPDDYDARVSANTAAIEALEKKYEDGDISFAEMRKGERQLQNDAQELRDIKFRADLAAESAEQAMRTNWAANISAFLPLHPEVSGSQVKQDAFDHFLRQTTAPVMEKGGQPGMKEINAAYVSWCAEFGFTPKAGSELAKPAPQKQTHVVPPSLGGVPAAAANSVEDGRFAAIDRLEGPAYEEALAKLSAAELEAFSQR